MGIDRNQLLSILNGGLQGWNQGKRQARADDIQNQQLARQSQQDAERLREWNLTRQDRLDQTGRNGTLAGNKAAASYLGAAIGDLQAGKIDGAGFSARVHAGSKIFGYDPAALGFDDQAPAQPSAAPQAPPTGAFGLPMQDGPDSSRPQLPNFSNGPTGGGFQLSAFRQNSTMGMPPNFGAPSAPDAGFSPPPPSPLGLGPNAASVIGNRTAATNQRAAKTAGEFTAKLPVLLAAVGNLPHASQTAAVQAIIRQGQALGVDVSQISLPGQAMMGPDGQPLTRARNYGQPPAKVALIDSLRALLAKGNAPTDSVQFGGRKYDRPQFNSAFPSDPVFVTAPFYGPSQTASSQIAGNQARAAATTGNLTERTRHNKTSEAETHAYHQGSLTETNRSHTLTHTDRMNSATMAHQDRLTGQGLAHQDRLTGMTIRAGGTGRGSGKDELGAVDKEIARVSTPAAAKTDKDPTSRTYGQSIPGKALKDTPEGRQYLQHLQNRRRQILTAPVAPLNPGVSPGYAIVPGVGRVSVPRGLGPLPGLLPARRPAASPAPRPAGRKPPKRSYRAMSDHDLIYGPGGK